MNGKKKKIEDSRLKRLFLLAEIDNFTKDERKQYYNNIIDTAAEEEVKAFYRS